MAASTYMPQSSQHDAQHGTLLWLQFTPYTYGLQWTLEHCNQLPSNSYADEEYMLVKAHCQTRPKHCSKKGTANPAAQT
jgi:hypothetical protein